MQLIISSLAFNFFWFVAVVGQYQYISLLWILLFAVFIFRPKLILIAPPMALLGIGGDSLLNFSHVLNFTSTTLPLWMSLLWLAFSCYLWEIKDFLFKKSRGIILAIGSIGGLMSYLGGHALGAVEFGYSMSLTTFIIAITWLIYTSVLLLLLEIVTDKEKQWFYTLKTWLSKFSSG